MLFYKHLGWKLLMKVIRKFNQGVTQTSNQIQEEKQDKGYRWPKEIYFPPGQSILQGKTKTKNDKEHKEQCAMDAIDNIVTATARRCWIQHIRKLYKQTQQMAQQNVTAIRNCYYQTKEGENIEEKYSQIKACFKT